MESKWKHVCMGGEVCSGCGRKATPGEERTWVSSMDQDDLYCKKCKEN